MRSGSQKLPPKYIPLSFPEVRAYIRPILREDGSVNITADLQYADGGKHDWDIRCTRSAKSVAEIDIVAPQMAAELAQRYAKRLREISVTTNCEKPYSTAFHALDDMQRRGLVPHTRQSEKYIQQSLSDFSIILNILDRYGLDLNDADLDAIVAARRKLAESSKNAIKDPETTTTTVNKALKNFNVLYPMLRAAQPDFHLPELHLPLLLGGRGAKREQVKVLPDDMLLMFAALLWRLIGYGLTLGAVLMLTGMARTAEACAPKFKHFIIYDDYAVFGVFYQSNNAIVPIDILKTRSAYRLVILPKYARNLIVATMEHLKAEGFAESDIMELPAVSSPNKPQTMAAPKRVIGLRSRASDAARLRQRILEFRLADGRARTRP